MVYSVSYTTRKPRQGEQDGVDYFFISKTEFRKRIDCNLWAEWAQVHGHYYGTSSELLDQSLNAGVDMLLDIDVEGTIQILNRYPESVTIFILPPSLDILRRRLESRGTEDRSAVQRRLNNAEREMAHKDMYRHIIINDRLPEATTKLISLVQTYRAGGRP
jgi:guanylate kinase